MTPPGDPDQHIRVMGLHSITYCERLYYLEEVEEIRVADAAVFAGRELHELLGDEDASQTESRNFDVSSDALGLTGRMDAFRRREGAWVPYEHKRGRSARGHGGAADAWRTDQVQVGAYAMLLEEETGERVTEGRIRYHQSGVTVRVPITDEVRQMVRAAIEKARTLRASRQRPPVTDNPRLCLHCSLAPVCLPEEERLARDPAWEPVRLFPPAPDGQVVHVLSHSSTVGRSGESLVIRREDEGDTRLPIREVLSLVVHGNAQVTTQAIHLCMAFQVPVHWISTGGRYQGGLGDNGPAVQRRLRQYEALANEPFATALARRLAMARVESELRFALRATRGHEDIRAAVDGAIGTVRQQLREISKASSVEALRGYEGAATRAHFSVLAALLTPRVDERLVPSGRSRRPPRDRFNAALSFLYALLFQAVFQGIRAVGLEPAFGFYHTPRSASPPLVLDLMELFRVPLCDLPLIASLNRKQWDPDADFQVAKDHVWLSSSGRRKAIELFERRLTEQWRHPVVRYSLTYRRAIELEVRLLEKEWAGPGGLFARARLR